MCTYVTNTTELSASGYVGEDWFSSGASPDGT